MSSSVIKSKEVSYKRNFLTLLTGNSISQLIPFFIAPILSRLFSPVEFAIYANYIALVSLLGIIANGRLELAITLPKSPLKAQQIAFTGFVITVIITLISLVFPLFSDIFISLYGDKQIIEFLWYIPFGVASVGLLGVFNNWVLRQKQFNILTYNKIGQSLLNNFLAAILGYLGFGITGLILAWLVSQYFGVFYFWIKSNKFKYKKSRHNRKVATNILIEYKDFPLVNSIHAFTDVLASQFLLFQLITRFFGTTSLGLFSLMNKYVRAPIVLISSSVSQLYYVEVSKVSHTNTSAIPIFIKTIKTSFLFALPFVTLLLFFGPTLFSWYLGENWEMAGVYAQRISPVIFFSFIVSPISSTPILFNKQKQAYLFSLFGYSASILALFIATNLNWKFEDALLLYSVAFSIYYIVVIFWFISLIRKND